MARRRGRNQPDQESEETTETVLDPRHAGPWDSTERTPPEDDPSWIDLGHLIVKVRVGLTLQMPTDGEGEDIGSAVLVTDDAALELRAFASTKSGGLWDEIRDDLILEVERLQGQCEQVDGPWGPELMVRVPVEVEGEEGAFQPSRIVGIEGPRWLLRATFLGDAGLNPSDEGLLMDSLRDVIVVRGVEARIPREALLLTLPAGATIMTDEE